MRERRGEHAREAPEPQSDDGACYHVWVIRVAAETVGYADPPTRGFVRAPERGLVRAPERGLCGPGMLAVGALWRALLGEDEDESRALWFPAGVSPHERFVQLRALALGVSRELEPRERRVRGRLHAACLTGAELHSWLLAHGGRYLRARRPATPAPRDADEAEAERCLLTHRAARRAAQHLLDFGLLGRVPTDESRADALVGVPKPRQHASTTGACAQRYTASRAERAPSNSKFAPRSRCS